MRLEYSREELNSHKGKLVQIVDGYEFTLKVPVFYKKHFAEDGFFIDLDEEDLKKISHKVEIGELDFELLIRPVNNKGKKKSWFKRLWDFFFKSYREV